MEVTIESRVRANSVESAGVGVTRPMLAIDTATDRAAVALGLPDGAILASPLDESKRQARRLSATIRDLLREARLRVQDLEAVGVGLGPGSFTGLRIGVTAAKTLAYAVGCRVVGLDSLEVLARNAQADVLSIAVMIDAQRGDVFVAEFLRRQPGDVPVRVEPTRVISLTRWIEKLAPGTLVLGPRLGREPEWPERLIRGDVEAGFPDGRRLIELTRERSVERDAIDPWFLEPNYVRRSAAEEKAG